MLNACHPERSEGSILVNEMLRFAQHDHAHFAFTIPHSTFAIRHSTLSS